MTFDDRGQIGYRIYRIVVRIPIECHVFIQHNLRGLLRKPRGFQSGVDRNVALLTTRGVCTTEDGLKAGHILTIAQRKRIEASILSTRSLVLELEGVWQFIYDEGKIICICLHRSRFTFVEFFSGDHIQHTPFHILQGIASVVTCLTIILVG